MSEEHSTKSNNDAGNNDAGDDDAPMSTRDKLFFLGVMTVIALGAGFVMMSVFEDMRLQMHAHNNFVPVQAKVLESEVKTRNSHGSGNNRVTHYPYIYYRFEIDGKGYRSKRYSYAFGLEASKSRAQEIVAAYPPGAVVTAYYNPENPKKALLDISKPDPTWFYAFMALFGAIYLFIAGAVISAALPRRKAL